VKHHGLDARSPAGNTQLLKVPGWVECFCGSGRPCCMCVRARDVWACMRVSGEVARVSACCLSPAALDTSAAQ